VFSQEVVRKMSTRNVALAVATFWCSFSHCIAAESACAENDYASKAGTQSVGMLQKKRSVESATFEDGAEDAEMEGAFAHVGGEILGLAESAESQVAQEGQGKVLAEKARADARFVKVRFPLPSSLLQDASDQVRVAGWLKEIDSHVQGEVPGKTICIMDTAAPAVSDAGGVVENVHTKATYFVNQDPHNISLFSEDEIPMPAGCYTCLWPPHECNSDFCLVHTTCASQHVASLIVLPQLVGLGGVEEEAIAQMRSIAAQGVPVMLIGKERANRTLSEMFDKMRGARWTWHQAYQHHDEPMAFGGQWPSWNSDLAQEDKRNGMLR
jgi:hypothetical protein